MPYTDEQIIELAAIKVQEVVVPKVETFTDNVTKEVHSMHLEMKGNREFDATVIAQLNDVRHRVEKFDGVCKLVAELHTLFCKNGYMARFNALADAVQVFFRDRLATCPIASDVQAIERDMESRRVEALDRAEGRLRTRAEDDRAARRWRIATLISVAALVVSIMGGIVARALGWW